MFKISVIVPVYNVERYLEKCLDSLIKQDFNNYEIIIVNDGSTDKSLEVAERFKNKYNGFITLISQQNGGLGAARNTGIRHAQGEYLLFIDSDDSIDNNTLTSLYDTAIKDNADVVIFDYRLVDESYNTIANISGVRNHFGELKSIWNTPELLLVSPAAWNKLYKRSLFEENDILYPGNVWFEDIRTTLKLFVHAKTIVHCNKCLYNYLQRSGSIMNNSQFKVNKNIEIVYAMQDILDYYRSADIVEQFKSELEYLTVQHVLLNAIARIVRVDYKNTLINELRQFVEHTFPEYRDNKYLKRMNMRDKFLNNLIYNKHYWLLNKIYQIKK